jgi:hypothetical protein
VRATTSCRREPDVLDLVAIGCWPQRADADLAAHVAACRTCTELALLSHSISQLADDTMADARVPDASSVWHRAQARTRQEHARRAARPVTLVVLATVAALVAVTYAGWLLLEPAAEPLWTAAREWSWRALIAGDSALNWPLPSWWRWLAAALGAWAALLPVAFYLARAADRETQRSDV